MKINLGHIGISLFIIMNTSFELINIAENTVLSVLYFSIMYFTLLIWAIREYILSLPFSKHLLKYPFRWTKAHLKGDRFFLAMGMGFLARIIWELTKIGMDYGVYMNSVNNYQRSLLIIFFNMAVLLIVIQNGRNKNN